MPGLNLARIARAVETLMLDTVRIRRVTGETYDEVTMTMTPVYSEIYSGQGFIAPMGDPAVTTLGGEDVMRIQYEIGIPRSAAEVLPNDVVDAVVSSDGSLQADTDLIYVHDQIPTTFLSHRRVKGFRDVSAT